ncbi:hypothetical protein SAMN02745148_01347 [Modicisalibacter ilicicola DSM 19980]|uniref:Soluble cytochrome b562 n=1 Tax=Modicisalibacter ilicicola DSM 19980 TaxID=1121942 RepID=A0A1M4X6Y0_9GAMM|nr:DUF6746 family protein [Halomonas ilicicola]SHE89216.1 hypothetical protein SAMN02745148_01347 [Halomonas ilicicola DSM 19980]
MRYLAQAATLAVVLGSGTFAVADEERPEHFAGESAETLEQAVTNFSEYNQRLEELLNQELTPERMAKIHELSYTLENALAKIDEEVDLMSVLLEDMHLASESADPRTTKNAGKAYLNSGQTLVE